MARKKTKSKWEFGDFQTPDELATQAVNVLERLNFKPKSVIEPTCGKGSFLIAAMKNMPNVEAFVGFEINLSHINKLKERIAAEQITFPVNIIHDDFFTFDWEKILCHLPEPILILGNPPWVTSAELGMLQSSNLPEKSNFQGRTGYEAITGKANFDISEWMLLKHVDWLKMRTGIVAMLCKTAVARKILIQAWKKNSPINAAWIFQINAKKHFDAAVDACFFVMAFNLKGNSRTCKVYKKMEDPNPYMELGYRDNILVANIKQYNKWKQLRGVDNNYVWRSGVKHDRTKIMEFKKDGDLLINGNREVVDLEDLLLYPMLKSSDLSNGNVKKLKKYMLITQKKVGEDTSYIEKRAPKTWDYLHTNLEELNKRASIIYKNQPPFSIFGVGDYTFSPYKVGISGFYKKLEFRLISPFQNKPVVLDDTINFLACWSKKEATFIVELLNSVPAKEFYNSMIFWTEKRPITIEILKRLNLHSLSKELGLEKEYEAFSAKRPKPKRPLKQSQLPIRPNKKTKNEDTVLV